MADVLQVALTHFTASSPKIFPIKLKENSYPVVGSSFSGTNFVLGNHEGLAGVSSPVSKLIYVSSKDRYVYVSSSSLRSSSLHVRCSLLIITQFATCTWLKIKDCAEEVVVPFTRHNFV